MTAAVYASLQDDVKHRAMLSMTVTYQGSEKDFIRLTMCKAADQLFRLIALRREGKGLQCNAALLFDQQETLQENSIRAICNGFESRLLRSFATGKNPATLPANL